MLKKKTKQKTPSIPSQSRLEIALHQNRGSKPRGHEWQETQGPTQKRPEGNSQDDDKVPGAV